MMATRVLQPHEIKYVNQLVLTDMQKSLILDCVVKQRKSTGDLVFRFYRGHDPYNSADDECFMKRVTRGHEHEG